MGVVIETETWEPNPQSYLFLFFSCFFSIFLLPYFSKNTNYYRTPSLSDLATVVSPSPAFLRFQRSFLFIFSLASVIEGLGSVFGEFEYVHYGVSKDQIVVYLCVGSAASLVFGTFLGILSDMIGPKRISVLFCILHVSVGILNSVTAHPSGHIASICLALASSVFSFSFETWMVKEHDKLGHRQDLLSETFWRMGFFESVSLIGSQVLANLLLDINSKRTIGLPSVAVVFLSMMSILYISKEWKEAPPNTGIKEYKVAFKACILHDRKIWLLAWAQACVHFSIAIFWIFWAPTIVADGREVHLGLVYPCLMGAKMLGSTAVPWLHSGLLKVRIEDCLISAFCTSGLVLSIIAYDYQEIGVLVTLFCLFHACVGIILPSLARLRTMYVPNDLRGGMISVSLAPANAAILFVLIQRGYVGSIENATIIAFAAVGLFSAAGCIHLLKRWGKQPHENWHRL